jgi:hypothetical protein
VQDQAVEVAGDAGESAFRLGSRNADCANEQTKAILLIRKDMLDAYPDRRFSCIGLHGRFRYRLARRFAPVDAARHHVAGELLFGLL